MSVSRQMIALGFAGALVAAMATPSEARDRWAGAAAAGAIGFAAGAAVGSAFANPYDRPGYYAYGPSYGYRYGPRYNYGYIGSGYQPNVYAYAPAYGYAPGDVNVRGEYARQVGPAGGCWIATDSQRGYGYWGECVQQRRDAGRAAISGQYGPSARAVPPTR